MTKLLSMPSLPLRKKIKQNRSTQISRKKKQNEEELKQLEKITRDEFYSTRHYNEKDVVEQDVKTILGI